MYETIVNGVRYCFYDDHMTINDTALRYEYLNNIQNRGGDDPAFLFDYKGRTFSMPYSPNEYENIRPYMDKAAQTSPKADDADAIPLVQVQADPIVQSESVIQAEPVYSMPQGQPAQPKKKKSKKGCLIGIFILLVIILVGCIGLAGGNDSEPADTDNDVAVEEQDEEQNDEQAEDQEDDGFFEDLFEEEEKPATYKSIYKKYKKKIEKKAPKLVDEYNRECSGMSLEDKAELCNDKISILAEIETEGTEKMAEVMLDNSDDYVVYEDWAGKLYDVYEEEAGKITDAYMDSAM